MRRIVLTFGMIGGGIIVVMLFVSFALMGSTIDFAMGEVLGYTVMLLALSTIFFGVKSYRDGHLGGVITFGQAFKTGILIALTASALYVAGWMIYFYGVNPTAMDPYYDQQIEQIRQSGVTQQEIDDQTRKMTEQIEMIKNPIVMLGITFLEIFPVGLLITLISATILRKKNNVPSAHGVTV